LKGFVMKILVTGSEGMLGHELNSLLGDRHEIVGIDVNNVDIRDVDLLNDFVSAERPDLIIHAAAMTNVDGAEEDPDFAFAVNTTGSKNVALAAATVDAELVYISTDFVFDGEKNAPYNELDTPNPLNVYGASKLEGEKMVREFCEKSYITRTAWLYGKNGWNFADWVIATGKEKGSFSIVTDQTGSPTSTVDLSRQIERLIESGKYGTYHVAGLGCASRFDFARKALDYAGLQQLELLPTTSEDIDQLAKRPMNSCLDTMALRNENLCVLRPWEEALEEYVTGAY